MVNHDKESYLVSFILRCSQAHCNNYCTTHYHLKTRKREVVNARKKKQDYMLSVRVLGAIYTYCSHA